MSAFDPSRHLSNFASDPSSVVKPTCAPFQRAGFSRYDAIFGTFKHMPDRGLVERIASGEERPCVQMTAPELILMHKTDWDDVFCLYQIVAEARIRVWKNSFGPFCQQL